MQVPNPAIFFDLRQASRKMLGRHLGPSESFSDEHIKIGCLQRIADALEGIQDSLVKMTAPCPVDPQPETPAERKERLRAESKARAAAVYARTLASQDCGNPPELDQKQWNDICSGLSVRSRKTLRRLNATSLADLARHKRSQVALLPNCGPITMDELTEVLTRFGLEFAEE